VGCIATTVIGSDERAAISVQPRAPGTSDRRRRNFAFAAVLLAIVAAATCVRAIPIRAGFPYSSYVDEQAVIRPVANMIANRTWKPGAYDYPPLTMYAATVVAVGLQLLPGGGSIAAAARATVRDPIEANIHSTDLLLSGRLAVLAFGTATVVLCALLALRLSGRRAAVVAALLAALTPALVSRSAISIVDTPAACFTTASLLCASHIDPRRRMLPWALLAGVAAGFATATKYPAGTVILATFTVIAFATECPLRTRLEAMVASALAAVGVAMLAAPTLLFQRRDVLAGIRGDSAFYDTKTATYWHELVSGKEVGVPLVALAVVGLAFLVHRRRTRPLAVGYTVFATVLVVALARYPFQPFRNVLPIVPFLSVAAAVAIVSGTDGLRRAARPALRTGLVAAVALLVAVSMAASGWSPYRQRMDAHDDRIETREWLAQHVQPGDRILVAQELAFVPSELRRLGVPTTVQSLTRGVSPGKSARYDYVVVGDRASTRAWRNTIANRRLVASFGFGRTYLDPSSYRQPAQLVRIFAARGTRDPSQCFPFCG
jgi:dolichyl-phosphate-mannose-protein mannosyltransferase